MSRSCESRSKSIKRIVICANCRGNIEARALRVASLAPSIDQAIRDIIQNRVESADSDWTLDEDTNVPCCMSPGEGAACLDVCGPYLLHVEASRAGFSDDACYVAHLERTTPKNNNRPPQLILDDDEDDPARDPSIESQVGTQTESMGGQEMGNSALAEHHRKLFDLQSARGRLVMNIFMHQDPATATILQGVMAVLESTKRSTKAKLDEKRDMLGERRKGLECLQHKIEQLKQAVAVIEEERPRRQPALQPDPPTPHPTPDSFQKKIHPVSHNSPHPLLLAAGRSTSMHNHPSAVEHSICDLSVLTAAELATLRRSLKETKAPGYDMPVDFFARWLQVQRQNRIKGVPSGPPHWVVDLRDVRGRNAVMSWLPPGPPMTKNKEQRDHYKLCLLAVLQILVIPGAYARILGRLGISVARGDTRFCCIFENKYIESPKDEDVVRLLASHGVTVETANDCYQFCFNLLEAHHRENPDYFGPGASGHLLELARKELEILGLPPGLHSDVQDRLPTFNGLELAGRSKQ